MSILEKYKLVPSQNEDQGEHVTVMRYAGALATQPWKPIAYPPTPEAAIAMIEVDHGELSLAEKVELTNDYVRQKAIVAAETVPIVGNRSKLPFRVAWDDDSEEACVYAHGNPAAQVFSSNSFEGALDLIRQEGIDEDVIDRIEWDYRDRDGEMWDEPEPTATLHGTHPTVSVIDEDDDSMISSISAAMGVSPGIKSEEEKARAKMIEEARLAAEKAAEEVKEVEMRTLGEAARIVRASAILIAEAGEKIMASGYMGNLPPPLQHFIQNVAELEREFQAQMAGAAAVGSAGAAAPPAVPTVLSDFLKVAELEAAKVKAEKEAKRMAEEEEARKKAATAVHHGYADEDDDDEYKPSPEAAAEAAKLEEERKKIDDMFNVELY